MASPMVSPEIMTNLGPQEKIHRDQRQADNIINSQLKAEIIKIVFLIEIIGTRSNKEKEHDALFTLIPVFDGDRTQCEQWLDDMDQATRISGHDLRTELIKKSTGVVRNVIMMAHPDASDDDLINMIREDFSDAPMMNEAREELLHMHQKPEEQMHVYVYRYGRMHQRSSGIRAAEETHQHVIQDFIKSLKPKIKNKFANKFAEGRFQPRTLDHCIFTCTRSGEENSNCRFFSGMTSWIAGPLQQLMRSSPFPWMILVVLMKFLVTGTTLQIAMARVTTAASHGNRKMMANTGRTGTTNGRAEIISHGNTRIKSHGKTTRAKVINPVTPVLHYHKTKSSLFQQIVMRTCSRSSAPWLKHKLTRQSNQVAMGKKLMK